MTQDEQAARDSVVRFLDSYAHRRVDASVDAFAKSRPILLLGTNENEVVRSRDELREAFKRDFRNMRDIRFGERRNEYVVADAHLATVVMELPVTYLSNGHQESTLFRWDLTLAKEADDWKICAGMTSVPFGADTYDFPPSPA